MPKLTIAISSRALFNLEESHRIYDEEGIDAYCRHQVSHEDEILLEGTAFPLVKKLIELNDESIDNPKVEVVLLSKNSADTGLRIFNSIQAHKLDITRAAFTSGLSPYRYIKPFSIDLFLSMDNQDVADALALGFAAATIMPSKISNHHDNLLRIAFDGDSVIFSDDSEKIYKEKGLEAFIESEKKSSKEPMPGGPFKEFLSALHSIQSSFPVNESPIRTALITARSAPAHERVIMTLRAWDIRIDEVLFLGGMRKGEFLKAFDADIFFDDQLIHCESTSEHVATGHVPYGVANNKISFVKPTPEERAYNLGWKSYFTNHKSEENPYNKIDEDLYINWFVEKFNVYDSENQIKLYESWIEGCKSAYVVSEGKKQV